MSSFTYQMKQGYHRLKNKQGFVAAVVTTMGVTIGALLCALTLASLLLFKPLPYPEQDRLFFVEHNVVKKSGEIRSKSFNYPGLIDLYKNQSAFSEAALAYYGTDVLVSNASQPTMSTAYVTPEWFSLIQPKMAVGRAFAETEALDTFNPVAILSYEAWQEDFNGDEDILEQKVTFGSTSFRIVGVFAKSFIEPELFTTGLKTEVWFPWDFNVAPAFMRDRWTSSNSRQVFVGKLDPRVSVSQAEQTLTSHVNSVWQKQVIGVARYLGAKVEITLQPFSKIILGDSEKTVYMLLTGIIGLVLIACANISNLFMSRTAEQQKKLSIYAVLGAKKRDIFNLLFCEALILMLLSIVLALIVAQIGFHVLQTYLLEVLPRVNELSINMVTLSAALIIVLLLAFLFSWLSSNIIDYRKFNTVLQSSGKGTGFQVSKRVRQALMISQVAVAAVLVFINILLLQYSLATINQPMGFEAGNIWSARLTSNTSTPLKAEEAAPLLEEIKSNIAQLPQVEMVSQSYSPLDCINCFMSVKADEEYKPRSKLVDEKYFQMIGQPLLQGDYFEAADIRDRNNVVIVNDLFAEKLAPGGRVIGMELIGYGEQRYRIVGVVKSMQVPGEAKKQMTVYWPSSPLTSRMQIHVKEGHSISREQLVSAIADTTSAYSLFGLESLRQMRKNLLFSQFATVATTSILAVLTFFMAAIGLYGILNYGIEMRRFELGTRMALGAKRNNLIFMILRDNALPVGFGILASAFIVQSLYILYPGLFGGVLISLIVIATAITLVSILAIAIFTCYWPTRKYINRPVIYCIRGGE
ncbi:ABC transporter permease [Pseudoalteromonas maricaloris]|uniref:ABC transporter permease n=1 Tax=Pseudoalteromonas maricaloris TaxID=184924 RepID=UPI003C28D240